MKPITFFPIGLILIITISSCNKKTCPCPDVLIDTVALKFEKTITVSQDFPTGVNYNSPIFISAWTRSGNLYVIRSYFTIPKLNNINEKSKIKKASFVWYGDLTNFYDDRVDTDTSFINLTSASQNSILNLNWYNQPDIIANTKILVLPPYQRIGKTKIDATEVINNIRNGSLPNNVFLFRLKSEVQYRYKSYKSLNTGTPEEAPMLELILETPID